LKLLIEENFKYLWSGMATSVYTSDVALTTRARSCPSASAEFEGRGAEELNNELARSIEHMLSNANALDLASLCLVPGRLCWIVYIDAQVGDAVRGNFNFLLARRCSILAGISSTRSLSPCALPSATPASPKSPSW
jgi:hypothetical protein